MGVSQNVHIKINSAEFYEFYVNVPHVLQKFDNLAENSEEFEEKNIGIGISMVQSMTVLSKSQG